MGFRPRVLPLSSGSQILPFRRLLALSAAPQMSSSTRIPPFISMWLARRQSHISGVFTNNGTLGAYKLVASNPFGDTPSPVVTVSSAGPVFISYLRTLVDPVNFIATNSTTRWQVAGIVTTATNITSGDTSSYYLWDGTAGINTFVTHGLSFRPNQGDVLTFKGWLSSFFSTLELEAD